MASPGYPPAPTDGEPIDPAWAARLAAWEAWASGVMSALTADDPTPNPTPNPPPAPAGTTYPLPATAIPRRVGRRLDTPRTPATHIMWHTAENSTPATDGSAALVARYLLTQTERAAAGYHAIIDRANVLWLCDPRTTLAYGAAQPGWNAVSVHIAIAARTSDFVSGGVLAAGGPPGQITPRSLVVARCREALEAVYVSPWAIPRRRTTSLSLPGHTGHGDVQANRSDPGSGFPWAEVLGS